MNFFKIFIIIFSIIFVGTSYADNHDKKQEVLDQVKDIAKDLFNMQNKDSNYWMRKN